MSRIIAAVSAAVSGGMLVGFAVAWFAFAPESAGEPDVVRDIVDLPKMSPTVAEQHRATNFVELSSVEEIYALPSAFARSEALYALAGRSDAADVQKLIFAANRIADEVDRIGALRVLFFRLAELDPESALALARTDYFKGVRLFEQTVWSAWGRSDLDAALFAAKTQSTRSHQNTAAQSLFAAFGYMNNETTARIEAELGVEPDRGTRSRFLYQMADRSPAEAIAYINGMPRDPKQQEYIWWLAYYLSLQDATAALSYADLFENAADRERYRGMVQNSIAREDPKATIDRILADGSLGRSRGEFQSAMTALAARDIDAAMQYFDGIRSYEQKQSIGSIIAAELARKDPVEALMWARANRSGDFPYLEMAVLGKIVETDPQYAFVEAQNVVNPQVRKQLVAGVISHLVQQDPATAIDYLELIEDPVFRNEASSQLVSNWIRRDSAAALDWVLSKDDETVSELLAESQWAITRSDIDTAIRLLPRLKPQQQQNWRMQIAQQLAATRSTEEAQAFVRRFEGQPGYEQLQSSVISSLARTDTVRARQMADQLTDVKARDTAYVTIIGSVAEQDPRAAAAMLSSVSTDYYRGAATAQVATNWYNSDPVAAGRWVSGLPRGAARDDAIMHLSGQWRQPTREQQALVNSIEDDEKRGQAKLQRVYALMRSDPAAARELLEDPDIPAYQRQQVESMIKTGGLRY